METPPGMTDFSSHGASDQIRQGQWYRDGDRYIWREPTTKPLAHIRIEANRALLRGLAALTTTSEWRGQTLYVWSVGVQGTVRLEDGLLTTGLHFDWWSPATFVPYLKEMILSEVAAATVEVAGGTFFGSKEVFVIHGHNEAARSQLKLLLQSFGLKPIILVEQSDGGGMTIIEKFEFYAGICSFAFALMTPDDMIKETDSGKTIWHPRQNVTLELGWFMARLGRTRVMLLSKGDIEMPSDLQGILYLPFKESVMEVMPQLASRLREAGLM